MQSWLPRSAAALLYTLTLIPFAGCGERSLAAGDAAVAADTGGGSVDQGGAIADAGVAPDAAAAPSSGVRVSTDAPTFTTSRVGKATVLNGTSQPIYTEGCTAFSRQQRVDGVWVERGGLVDCGWQGVAVKVDPGKSRSGQMMFQAPGTWRVTVRYGRGCAPDKPLSQTHCASMHLAVSPTVTVAVDAKTCQSIVDKYAAAVKNAKSCTPWINVPQCTIKVQSSLYCGCATMVNDDKVLGVYAKMFKDYGCTPTPCPFDRACVEPKGAACSVTTKRCVDQR